MRQLRDSLILAVLVAAPLANAAGDQTDSTRSLYQPSLDTAAHADSTYRRSVLDHSRISAWPFAQLALGCDTAQTLDRIKPLIMVSPTGDTTRLAISCADRPAIGLIAVHLGVGTSVPRRYARDSVVTDSTGLAFYYHMPEIKSDLRTTDFKLYYYREWFVWSGHPSIHVRLFEKGISEARFEHVWVIE